MSELLDVAGALLAVVAPGEEAEVVLRRSVRRQVIVRDGEVENVEITEALDVAARVVAAGKVGTSTAKGHEGPILREALELARGNARIAAHDVHAGLPSPDAAPLPELVTYDDSVESLSMPERIALAQAMDAAAHRGDARIESVASAVWSDGWTDVAIASSAGVRRAERSSSATASVTCRAGDGNEVQFGSRSETGRGTSIDIEAVARDAAARAVERLGAVRPSTDRLPVVFVPVVTADFLSIIGDALAGDDVAFGQSAFADRVGSAIAAPIVRLVEDPTDPAFPLAQSFDEEGMAARQTVLIDGGVLLGFLHDTRSARRLGAQTTASAGRYGPAGMLRPMARALRLVPTTTSADLDAALGDAVVVTALSGLHSGASPISGDFSVGVSGFRIRGGERAEPIREATVASTIQRMLLDLTAVGDDVAWTEHASGPFGGGPRGIGSSIAIAEMTLSGA